MFGLCMPSGEVYLILKGGKKDSIEMSDLCNPRKEIMEDEWILKYIKEIGYKNIDAIVYERHNKKITITMADYYAEHGKELED